MVEQKKTYLIHFGVPGMKWGQRKQQRNKKDIQNAKIYNKKKNARNSAFKKLYNSNKSKFDKDFGGINKVDDASLFEYTARTKYKMNTNSYWNKVVDSKNFYKDNKKSIERGRKLLAKLK